MTGPGMVSLSFLGLWNFFNSFKSSKTPFHEIITKKIASGDFAHSTLMLDWLIDKLEIFSSLAPSKVLPVIEKWKSCGIIESRHPDLVKAINRRRIINYRGLIPYFERAVYFDLSKYSDNPEDYLPIIHKQISTILPELAYEAFKFSVKEKESNISPGLISYDFYVSIKTKIGSYVQRSYWRAYFPKRDFFSKDKLQQRTFYQIFNKILIDQESAYRLHLLKFKKNKLVDKEAFAIVALTKDQAECIREYREYFDVSREDFTNTFSKKRINSTLKAYKKAGLFGHLTEHQLKLAYQGVKENRHSSINDLLKYIPDLILHFDQELGNLTNPYGELTNEYGRISRGDFNPKNIEDSFPIGASNIADLSFTCQGKKFKFQFKIDNDWIDPYFYEAIDKVVRQVNLPGKFYFLPSYDQAAKIIYLLPDQKKTLLESGAISFDFDPFAAN
ncbi:MAG: hypothetical protein AAF741_19030 [Bacteroidota bacterium]